MGTNDSEEVKLAALTIVSFKKPELDLDELRRKYLHDGENGANPARVSSKKKRNNRSRKKTHGSSNPNFPLPEITLFSRYMPSPDMEETTWRLICDNNIPHDKPPVPCLEGLFRDCSKPFQKQLTASDTKETQSRLALSKAYVKNCIFPLLKEDEDPKEGIVVTTYDKDGTEFEMVYKLWAGQKFHVLSKGWKQFFLKHKKRMHEDFATVWAFRNCSTDKLCFAITWRRLPVYCPLKKRNNR